VQPAKSVNAYFYCARLILRELGELANLLAFPFRMEVLGWTPNRFVG
jgi:hypothetical protein